MWEPTSGWAISAHSPSCLWPQQGPQKMLYHAPNFDNLTAQGSESPGPKARHRRQWGEQGLLTSLGFLWFCDFVSRNLFLRQHLALNKECQETEKGTPIPLACNTTHQLSSAALCASCWPAGHSLPCQCYLTGWAMKKASNLVAKIGFQIHSSVSQERDISVPPPRGRVGRWWAEGMQSGDR